MTREATDMPFQSSQPSGLDDAKSLTIRGFYREVRKASKEEGRDKFPTKGLLNIYRTFGRHVKKYWKTMAFSYSCLFVSIGLTALSPWPLKLILDHLVLSEPLPEQYSFLNSLFAYDVKTVLLVLSCSLVCLVILEAFFSYVNKYWIGWAGSHIIADVRERIFKHLQRLSLSFHESTRTADRLMLVKSDFKVVKTVLVDFPQDFIHRVFTIAIYTFLMLALEWRLTLIAFATMPVFYFATRFISPLVKAVAQKLRERTIDVGSIVWENLTAMPLVQAYGREETERTRFVAGIRGNMDIKIQMARFTKLFGSGVGFFVTLSFASVLYFGGSLALGAAILPGTLIVFIKYIRHVFDAVQNFTGLFVALSKSMVPGDRLLDLVENEMIVQDEPNAIPAPALKGQIEFQNVSFSYKDDVDVLEGLSFTISAGETVALIGHSGAGKSTLISLLLRFYDPKNGRILMDGLDLRKFTLKSLRDQITILLQDAKLFRQSIRENIAFGKADATHEEIVVAAKLAEAHDFIMQMPNGYDTEMYEAGENLSGGEKQRINIARAIIRNTPIVILDEPATGLDARSESCVNAAISHLTQDKTTFIIAHRFSTLANADKILLLDKGRLLRLGTHTELMVESSVYRELYELQFGGSSASRQISGISRPDGPPAAASPAMPASVPFR